MKKFEINGTQLEPGQVWADEEHSIEWMYVGPSAEGFPVFQRLWDDTFLDIEKYYKSGLVRRFIGVMDFKTRTVI